MSKINPPIHVVNLKRIEKNQIGRYKNLRMEEQSPTETQYRSAVKNSLEKLVIENDSNLGFLDILNSTQKKQFASPKRDINKNKDLKEISPFSKYQSEIKDGQDLLNKKFKRRSIQLPEILHLDPDSVSKKLGQKCNSTIFCSTQYEGNLSNYPSVFFISVINQSMNLVCSQL